MNKVSITIDLGKLDKSRINTRTYTNKEGEEVTVKEYRLDVVPLKEKKTLKEGDGWKMVKTHFVADSPTKEERQNKTKTNFIGEGISFENTEADEDTVNLDDMPF